MLCTYCVNEMMLIVTEILMTVLITKLFGIELTNFIKNFGYTYYKKWFIRQNKVLPSSFLSILRDSENIKWFTKTRAI